MIRSLAFMSTPILEDDFNRYLWDGAVSAAGLSPFEFAPGAFRTGEVDAPRSLLVESVASGGVLARVNHPHLTTIYPPVAQAAFRLANAVRPFSLVALRGVFLLFDAAATLLLWALLRHLELPRSLLVVWAWNPLFVRESINSVHMDVLLIPFLLAAVLFSLRGRSTGAAVSLALATGVKLWPVLLAPLLLAPRLEPSRKALSASSLYVVLTAALLFPMARGVLEPHAGVAAYASGWAMNAGLWQLLAALLEPVLGSTGLRLGLAAAFAAFALLLARTAPARPEDLLRRASAVPAALLLLGPTAYPWYFTWLLPFLVAAPGSLLLLTATLPLYDLGFALERAGHARLFHGLVVPLEWIPVWGSLAFSAGRRWRRGLPPSEEVQS